MKTTYKLFCGFAAFISAILAHWYPYFSIILIIFLTILIVSLLADYSDEYGEIYISDDGEDGPKKIKLELDLAPEDLHQKNRVIFNVVNS